MRKTLSAIMLFASVSLAHAGPKEDAYQVVAKWAKAFTEADVTAIAKLYAPDALMIGTLGKIVLTRPEQIRQYFDRALNTDKPRTATLVAGFDTITATKDGQQTIGKRRVTFVVAKRGSGWMIVHLHRSPLPAT